MSLNPEVTRRRALQGGRRGRHIAIDEALNAFIAAKKDSMPDAFS